MLPPEQHGYPFFHERTTYQMNPNLSKLLSTIERNLTDWIPMGVKELDCKSPAYCLFVWYQDYSGDFTPHIGIATQELLKSANSKVFSDPLDKYDMIWRPQQCADLDVPGQLLVDECDIVESEVEDCYDILAEESGLFDELDNQDDEDSQDPSDLDEEDEDDDEAEDDDEELAHDEQVDEDDEEFETLVPFREMMHRVGKNLQQVEWHKILPVTDDFVVLVCDYVGYWLPEDFEECVDDELYERLVARGLIQPLAS